MNGIVSKPSRFVYRFVSPVVCVLMFALLIPAVGNNAEAATWSTPVQISPTGSYNSVELAVGGNALYALSWEYPWGHVQLWKGSLDGSSWGTPVDPFGMDLYWTAPGICAYPDGGEDVVLVAAAPGIVAKSTDSALTFSPLADLPIPSGASYWRYLDIQTDASMLGSAPNPVVYVAGSLWKSTPYGMQFVISFTKSLDGGETWLPPVEIGALDHFTYWPKLATDGTNLYMFYCGLNPDLTNQGMFVRTSSDWGLTWSEEILLETPTQLGIFARTIQTLDSEKAMMVCVDYGDTHVNSVMRYGYFDFATLTFDEIGNETGADWCFIYCAADAYLRDDGMFQLVWSKGLPSQPCTIFYTQSSSTAFAFVPIPPPWTPQVEVSEGTDVYFGLDLELGQNNIYALSYVYPSGPTRLHTSPDSGTSWTSQELVSWSSYTGEPGMCAYREGYDDVILVASGEAGLLRSTDSGATFGKVSDLPTVEPGFGWRFMAVGTNASWFGTPADSDIYVIGSRNYYDYGGWIGGGFALTFTKSSDNGLTWSTPVRICESNHDTQFPEMISDGQNLYVVYSDSDTEFADLYVRSSSDWGATWSAEKVLLARQPTSEWICAYSFQHLNSGKALLTMGEFGAASNPDRNPIGRYGYFDYATQTFTEVGFVDGHAWEVAGGFAGKLTPDGTFCLVWVKATSHPFGDIWYTTNAETGLTPPEQPPQPAIIIYKGAPPSECTYQFTASENGRWQAKFVNRGLRNLILSVYDVTTEKKVLIQRINFASGDAYPEGVMFSKSVKVTAGHTYEVIAKKPSGFVGGYAYVYNEFSTSAGASSAATSAGALTPMSMTAVASALIVMPFVVRSARVRR